MGKLALAGFVLIASIASASAADLPTHKGPLPADPSPVVYDWTGFYAGLNGGGAWGRSDPNTTIGCPTTGYFCTPAFFTTNGPQIAGLASGSKNSSGFTGGAQVGYNWRAGNLVYGLEGDFGAFHLQGSTGGPRFIARERQRVRSASGHRIKRIGARHRPRATGLGAFQILALRHAS
jgi:hypothetical protein